MISFICTERENELNVFVHSASTIFYFSISFFPPFFFIFLPFSFFNPFPVANKKKSARKRDGIEMDRELHFFVYLFNSLFIRIAMG